MWWRRCAPARSRSARSSSAIATGSPPRSARSGRRCKAHQGPARLAAGGRMLWRGQWVELQVAPVAQSGVRVRHDGWFEVRLPSAMPEEAREAAVEAALRRWLKRAALADARRWVERHGPRHGLVPSAVRIKEHKHLWGSCSSQGAINLNWRLILAPGAGVRVRRRARALPSARAPPPARLLAPGRRGAAGVRGAAPLAALERSAAQPAAASPCHEAALAGLRAGARFERGEQRARPLALRGARIALHDPQQDRASPCRSPCSARSNAIWSRCS